MSFLTKCTLGKKYLQVAHLGEMTVKDKNHKQKLIKTD